MGLVVSSALGMWTWWDMALGHGPSEKFVQFFLAKG